MDLSALGITPETITKDIIDRAVDEIVRISVYGPDDGEVSYDGFTTTFRNKLQERVEVETAKIIDRISTEFVEPKVVDLIDRITFQETNSWGEPKKAPKTWREMLVERAEGWLSEQVNYEGKVRSQESYSWKANGTRISFLVDKHIQYEIERSLKQALTEINSKVADGLTTQVKITLKELLDRLNIKITTR